MTFRFVHGRQLTDTFQVSSEVRQSCKLSNFLFLRDIIWVLKTSPDQKTNGIQ
ncbi:hypothetical protein DPMN_066667 [Dreissena polymorpha]|uniref:Uncharacterized protein n=1 Tax=Dreissena polymorpha TaxID=45954 RepID=A0A9D4BT22_DREPO|nr:hypothetical protein DPMN_066667 [Dreissena polymorpha]